MPQNEIAKAITNFYSQVPDVVAISLAGSTASGKSDEQSDLDFYIYSHGFIPLPLRAEIIKTRADHFEVGNTLWESHDAWIERENGKAVEVVFRTIKWVEESFDRVLKRHEASLGYSTGIWHSIKFSQILFDRHGWYEQLQQLAASPYPEQLRRAIIEQNRLAMKGLLVASYVHQIELAISRNDIVSINHRIAALLASYFDIVFAVNRMPHPGEKRQVIFVTEHCTLIPNQIEEDLKKILLPHSDFSSLVSDINTLLDRLDVLLNQEKLI